MKENPETYWENAGKIGYDKAMYVSADVGTHITRRLWYKSIEMSRSIGMKASHRILDLGCGDGALANQVLAKCFKQVDGIDLSTAAIQRAQQNASANTHFEAHDITQFDYATLPKYDGIFMWGILHHVKLATPTILNKLRNVAPRLIILEPNGNHLLRKMLEFTPSYRRAGEDSFRTSELKKIFNDAGFTIQARERLNIFPNFTPKLLFHLLKRFEPVLEKTPILQGLCTVNLWGLCRA